MLMRVESEIVLFFQPIQLEVDSVDGERGIRTIRANPNEKERKKKVRPSVKLKKEKDVLERRRNARDFAREGVLSLASSSLFDSREIRNSGSGLSGLDLRRTEGGKQHRRRRRHHHHHLFLSDPVPVLLISSF